MTHTKVYRTELTPVSFLERSAYVFPDKIAVVHGDRGATPTGSSRSASIAWPPRCARAGLAEARPGGLPLPQHPGHARGALRRARRRRHPGRHQHPAQRATRSATSSSTPARRFLFVDAELRGPRQAARPRRCPRRARRRHRRARRSVRGLPGHGLARRGRRAGSRTRRRRSAINYTSGTTGPAQGRHVHRIAAPTSTRSARCSRPR